MSLDLADIGDTTTKIERVQIERAQAGGPVRIGSFLPNSSEWHAARAGGIGGSEVAAILGLSPWESPYSLWVRKQEGSINFVDTPATEWGTRLESVVADKFLDNHPEFVGAEAGTWHGEGRPWQIANPDKFLTDPTTGALELLEIKTARYDDHWGPDGSDIVPAHYRPQGGWYADVFGVTRVWFAVLIGGSDYREYLVEYDPAELVEIRNKVRAFLDTLETGEKPDLDDQLATYTTVRAEHPEIAADESVEISVDVARQYIAARGGLAAAESAELLAKSTMADAMGSAKTARCGEHVIATRQAKGNGSPYVVASRKLPDLAALTSSSDDAEVGPAPETTEPPTSSNDAAEDSTPSAASTSSGEAASGDAAGGPSAVGPSPEPSTTRLEWVLRRLERVREAGHIRSVSTTWPKGDDAPPTPKAIREGKAEWTPEQLLEVDKLLAAVEAKWEMPFDEPDPEFTSPRHEKIAERKEARAVALAEADAAPAPLVASKHDGTEVDQDDIDNIRGVLAELDPALKAHVIGWSKQAQAAGTAWNIGKSLQRRRYAISAAAIALVEHVDLTEDDPDELVRAALRFVTDGPVDGHPVGAVLGTLDVDQAMRLGDVLTTAVVKFDDAGTPQFIAAA